ncbi:MAG: hypothetical protein FJW37_08970 [Acidobacteria bacterium]|nr:hypothetical protein [Acidobacteriota bacterium]
MDPALLHLHSYFLFPFSVDKEAVVEDYRETWPKNKTWFGRLDEWISEHRGAPLAKELGPWQRATYTRFDMESPAYQDMVFFHPFVRRVFFDAQDPALKGREQESLLNCYTIPLEAGRKLRLGAEDGKGRSAMVEVTDLRLFLFANGIGILSIGVEAFQVPVSGGLWINEMLRKIYPSSARQLREGRAPARIWLEIERDGSGQLLVEERFERAALRAYQPPLAKTITGLLYFTDYSRQEYEPVLDERMIVYSYAALDPATVPQDYAHSEEYQILLSRFLYVDQEGAGYRYDPDFTRKAMESHLYRRWAQQGTYYGFTSYSSIAMTIGTFDCDEHTLREGFLVHRMFASRYYLISIITLFYRATLLDFAERTALVSRQVYHDQDDGQLSPENIRLTNRLRADFLHFANHWYFDELANKDEEMEHFHQQCRAYRLQEMKSEGETEIEKLNSSLNEYYGTQSALAVNRLAMLSMVLGAGAVVTGYFGMNFGREFGKYFFEPEAGYPPLAHYGMIALVSAFALAALVFVFFRVIGNWRDYRDILMPGRRIEQQRSAHSLRRGPPAGRNSA